jgi:hypothetical protein
MRPRYRSIRKWDWENPNLLPTALAKLRNRLSQSVSHLWCNCSPEVPSHVQPNAFLLLKTERIGVAPLMAGQMPVVVVVSPRSSLRNLRTKGGHSPWFRAPVNLFRPFSSNVSLLRRHGPPLLRVYSSNATTDLLMPFRPTAATATSLRKTP